MHDFILSFSSESTLNRWDFDLQRLNNLLPYYTLHLLPLLACHKVTRPTALISMIRFASIIDYLLCHASGFVPAAMVLHSECC